MLTRLLLALITVVLAAPAGAQDPLAPCTDGVAVLPDVGAFPCDGVDLVGYLSVSAFATSSSPAALGNNDIWGWTDPQTGTEYALVGSYNGTSFVDLSDPAFPRLVGKLPTTNELAPVWRDVKVYADHAFIVADNARDHGMQVFDLTRLRGVTGAPVTFTADALYTGIRSAHNVVIDEESGFAYAVGFRYPPGAREALGLPPSCDAPGFHAIDVRDPKNPTFAGCFSDEAQDASPVGAPGYTHDAQCLVYRGPDADYTGRQLCIAANEETVTVFDVTDKDAVEIVSQAFYPNPAYTHQGWLTQDQRFFLADDELDERNQGIAQRTIVIDYLDLDDPEVAFIYNSGLTSIDHNQYVRGGLSFQSNYETGLRILDVSQAASGTLTEVAHFDTFPESDQVSFDGQWSNYPYFESGLVIANDSNNGLFVLRPDVGLVLDRQDGAETAGYSLSAPAPNPTASRARLTLRVEAPQSVRAELFDTAGRRVASVFDGAAAPGAAVRLSVSGADLPAGVYVLRVAGETFEASRRVVIAR
jgi:choice-of-anchor B domain-containing protein